MHFFLSLDRPWLIDREGNIVQIKELGEINSYLLIVFLLFSPKYIFSRDTVQILFSILKYTQNCIILSGVFFVGGLSWT